MPKITRTKKQNLRNNLNITDGMKINNDDMVKKVLLGMDEELANYVNDAFKDETKNLSALVNVPVQVLHDSKGVIERYSPDIYLVSAANVVYDTDDKQEQELLDTLYSISTDTTLPPVRLAVIADNSMNPAIWSKIAMFCHDIFQPDKSTNELDLYAMADQLAKKSNISNVEQYLNMSDGVGNLGVNTNNDIIATQNDEYRRRIKELERINRIFAEHRNDPINSGMTKQESDDLLKKAQGIVDEGVDDQKIKGLFNDLIQRYQEKENQLNKAIKRIDNQNDSIDELNSHISNLEKINHNPNSNYDNQGNYNDQNQYGYDNANNYNGNPNLDNSEYQEYNQSNNPNDFYNNDSSYDNGNPNDGYQNHYDNNTQNNGYDSGQDFYNNNPQGYYDQTNSNYDDQSNYYADNNFENNGDFRPYNEQDSNNNFDQGNYSQPPFDGSNPPNEGYDAPNNYEDDYGSYPPNNLDQNNPTDQILPSTMVLGGRPARKPKKQKKELNTGAISKFLQKNKRWDVIGVGLLAAGIILGTVTVINHRAQSNSQSAQVAKPSFNSLIKKGNYDQAAEDYPDRAVEAENKMLDDSDVSDKATFASRIQNYSKSDAIKFDNFYFNEKYNDAVDLLDNSDDDNLTHLSNARRVMAAYSLMKTGDTTRAEKEAKPLDNSELTKKIQLYKQFQDSNKKLEEKIKSGNLSDSQKSDAKKMIRENEKNMDNI
ncbi:MAG: hypothetical protein N5848_00855 [Lactobacillus crispatus]|nr:hypothetical protein [Lactobacillus crispatus]MCT7707964.1 hypothetical protein [Lactobacillus crispatus]